MKLAIMQPYLFPYIGYFQLITAADKFVIYDDVQFIKEGWVHRNRLLVNKQSKQFTLPLKKDSHRAKIYQRHIAIDRWEKDAGKMLTMIQQSYGKAPYYKSVYPLVESCIHAGSPLLIEFLLKALKFCCDYMGIATELVCSSSLDIATDYRGQDRIIAMCKELKADHYINAIGGRDLYSRGDFGREGINLSFIKPLEINYPQFGNEFIPWLSVIDVMMFNSPEQIRKFLSMYKLI